MLKLFKTEETPEAPATPIDQLSLDIADFVDRRGKVLAELDVVSANLQKAREQVASAAANPALEVLHAERVRMLRQAWTAIR